MLPRDHARNIRKLRILTKRLERMIGNGSFYELPFFRRYALVRRVRRLYGSLLGPLSPAGARTLMMAGAASVAMIACCPEAPKADNPSFAAPTKNPFGLAAVAAPAAPAFADIDADGDADLFAGAGGEDSGVIRFFENTGSRTAPSFAEADDYLELPEPTTPTYTTYGPVPTLAPIKNSPLFDMFIGNSIGGYIPMLEFYENGGTTFTSSTLPAYLPTVFSYYNAVMAAVVDINDDALIDLFVSSSVYDFDLGADVNKIEYWKNTGTSSAPEVTDQATTLGLDLPAGAYGYPTFIDIDADEDFDAFVGDENGDLWFFRNTGTAASPSFATPVKNPFGLSAVPAGPGVPAFMDIDADGDFDLFVGDGNGDLWYYRNDNL